MATAAATSGSTTVALDRPTADLLDSLAGALKTNRSAAVRHLLQLHSGAIEEFAAGQIDFDYDPDRWNRRRLVWDMVVFLARQVRAGSTFENAYRLAGVTPEQRMRWEKQGRADMSAGKQSIYADLVYGLERASAELHMDEIAKARKDRGSYKWLLPKLDPAQFGERRTVEQNVRHTIMASLDYDKLSVDELRVWLELTRKMSPDSDELGRNERAAIDLVPSEVLEIEGEAAVEAEPIPEARRLGAGEKPDD